MDKVVFSFSKTDEINSQNEEFSSNNSLSYNFANNEIPNDIYALAKAFLSISSMTNKKLQKLCYYAKAWYLAIYDTNIISEDFQAWVHGAVQPGLYYKYKEYGFNSIPKIENTNSIPEEFISFANEIYSSYGHLSGDQLEVLNHQEDPWINARKGCEPWENCNSIISETDMKDFYRRLMKDE